MALPNSPRCVITGAGGGLGRALALELSRRGAHLLLSDLRLEGAEETARLAQAAGAGSVQVRSCDVTKVDQVQALAEAAKAAGPVDLVVNNAGVASGGLVGEMSLEDWRWTLEVDLLGVIHGCHAFVPLLRQQQRGHVLNVASAAGLLCAPRMGAYNVAKAGVIALSETLAVELAGTGAGVTVLCPTFFRTGLVGTGRFADDKSRNLAERMIARGTGVERVAQAALGAVARDDLYALPMADGRWLWRLKRVSPRAYRALLARAGQFLAARA